jgi:predicted CoA-substrate-specific enzyme activase
MADGVPVFATGYGRKLVPDADRAITEITCHARGVFADTGMAGTLVDIGGQDSKVIRIGPKGSPIDFAMNDKCAAGTGRFLEHTAARLGVSLDDLGPTALGAADAAKITSTCTVFAESEIISLVAHGEPVDRILLGLHAGLVSRILAMVRSVGLVPPLLLSGGVARNCAIVALLAEQSGQPVHMPSRPQLMGAYGAAMLAAGQAGSDPADGPVAQVRTGECEQCAEPAARRGLLSAFRRSGG